MDKIVSLLTTTDGRIGRQQWWLGAILIGVISIALMFIVSALGLGANESSLRWTSFIIGLILIYPAYCLGLKRRWDRDNNGLDLKILLGLSVLSSLIQTLGIGLTPTDIGNGIIVQQPAIWLNVLQLPIAVFALYVFVQLGFLKGTSGSNSYGADPLQYPETV
ncbi:hypothetical protein WH87_11495 [Devosia epidermidihirudinis]|uniref:DUF805 domain-containing protein n=1 Tax=Devosia epidermidihirudinis TaxID=1293439 RepID=A0A0F5QDX6_9HYPH|nr:hypothetical protein WH87_11495 [Devosia epidermidihirudinis]